MGNIDWTAVGGVGQLMATALTVIGLLLVARQIHESGKVANADFVLRMEEGYASRLNNVYE